MCEILLHCFLVHSPSCISYELTVKGILCFTNINILIESINRVMQPWKSCLPILLPGYQDRINSKKLGGGGGGEGGSKYV